MTKIKDILSIHLEEDIKSVIDLNQQGEDEIIEELDGFILTESLAKHLTDFCDFFTSNTAQPGLWLSGFYGSGKSYFSKMIGFLLKNPTIKGTSIRERFKNKLVGLPNAGLLQNNIDELGRTRNHIVLFDAAKTTGNHGISYMMMGAFLKSLGLNDDWVGIVEFNLLISGRYQLFCDKVQEKYNESWVKRRKNMDQVYDTLEETMIDGFCSENAYDEMRDAAKQRISDYDANRLQEDLKRYAELYPDVRIVFMIEEVSEAIAEYQNHTHLIFCLKSLRNLANNGRVNPAVAAIAGVLNIHVVGVANEGVLDQREKARGAKKALVAIDTLMKEVNYNGGKVIIDHCFNEKDANAVRNHILASFPNAEVRIEETRGLCSFYAEVGGLMIGVEA